MATDIRAKNWKAVEGKKLIDLNPAKTGTPHPASAETPAGSATPEEVQSICGVELPKEITAHDIENGHLPAKSFEFTLPPNLHGRLAVTPGIRCDDFMLGFPLFGGVSRQKDYFNLTVIEGNASAFEAAYPEQWLHQLRIYFDNGQNITTGDALLSGKPPAGAKRIVRIEMDFKYGDSVKATLVWGAKQ